MNRTIFTRWSEYNHQENALNKIKNNKQLALFACDTIRLFQPFWENHNPDGPAVLKFVKTIEDYILNLANLPELLKNRVFTKTNMPLAGFGAVIYAANDAYYVAIVSSRVYAVSCAVFNNNYASYITDTNNYWDFVYQLYLQCFKPKHITIPKKPLFVELAQEIKDTRNFSLYNILVDAVYDYTNIKIKTKCLGLSNWLLFDLLTKENLTHSR